MNYYGLDLAQLTDFYQFAGPRFAGRASGHNLLEWPMGSSASIAVMGR